MSQAPVTAVIVTYQSAAVIADALRPLQGQALIAQVIVTDNASTDNTLETVAGFAKNMPVQNVALEKNQGFGAAANRGLERVATPYALLMNPDAQIDEANLRVLFEAAKTYKGGAIFGPRLQLADGTFQQAYRDNPFNRRRKTMREHEASAIVPVEDIPAAVWLLRMEAIKRIGGFDEGLFLFYEDDDVCMRMKEAGYGVYHVPGAVARHGLGKGSEPTPQTLALKQYHLGRSRVYIEKKYRGIAAARWLRLKLSAVALFKMAGYFLLFRKGKFLRHFHRLKGAWG